MMSPHRKKNKPFFPLQLPVGKQFEKKKKRERKKNGHEIRK